MSWMKNRINFIIILWFSGHKSIRKFLTIFPSFSVILSFNRNKDNFLIFSLLRMRRIDVLGKYLRLCNNVIFLKRWLMFKNKTNFDLTFKMFLTSEIEIICSALISYYLKFWEINFIFNKTEQKFVWVKI